MLSWKWNNLREFGTTWLWAFMFYYSIALGALFLVMIHHLTDAGWSVGIRRFCEHISSLLFPWLAVLFLPVALMGNCSLSIADVMAAVSRNSKLRSQALAWKSWAARVWCGWDSSPG